MPLDKTVREGLVGCTAVLRWCIFCAVLQRWDSVCVTFPEPKISCNCNRREARVGHNCDKNQGFLIPATD